MDNEPSSSVVMAPQRSSLELPIHNSPAVATEQRVGNTLSADSCLAVAGGSKEMNEVSEPAPDEPTNRQRKAATDIQRIYRGHRTRRELRGLRLTAEERWMDAIGEAMYRTKARPLSREERIRLLSLKDQFDDNSRLHVPEGHLGPSPGENSAEDSGSCQRRTLSPSRDRWKRAAYLAKMVQHDDPEREDTTSDNGEVESCGDPVGSEKQRLKEKKKKRKLELMEHAKAMDAQYFLELVDLKHRYGSNLKVYHDFWKAQPTNENFFYWLDIGSGKDLSLTACPKDQLETERVKYLSREERQAYLVEIDDKGRLCWAKNGERIDTSEKYKNSKHGIVPLKETDQHHHELHTHETRPASSSSSSSNFSSSSASSSSSTDSLQANRYTNAENKKAVFNFSPAHILNRLLRKTTKKNTWIFVADTSFRLYVGIKQSGAFQHSSFLHGARVSAAGLIKIKDGKLKSLAPLSGHYRPPASNFKCFLESLKEAGVDMSGVTISKSYTVLVGLEAYSKMKKEHQKAKEKFQEHHPHLSGLHLGKRRDTSPSSAGHTTDDCTKEKRKRNHFLRPKEKKDGGEIVDKSSDNQKDREEESALNDKSRDQNHRLNNHANNQ